MRQIVMRMKKNFNIVIVTIIFSVFAVS